jgi:regulator of protease activity HflC (stomatin/prohibitin superfamily)
MPDQRKQLPLRHAEVAATFILIVQAVGGLAALLVAWGSRSMAAMAGGWHLAAGVLVWLACVIHQRLRRMALEEELDTETLRETGDDRARLFEEQEADLLSAKRRVEQFEKYFLPLFSVLVCLVLGYLCYTFLRRVVLTPKPDIVQNPAMTAVIFGFASLISFLLSRYSAGLAVEPAWRPVRPGAHYSMSCAIVSLLVTLALAATHFRVAWAEPIVAHAVPILMGLLAVETLLFIIWGIYRPRVAGVEWRPAHDSRLLGAITTSGGILRATADTLDYQFGFKVSETWFYRFMERAIAPLVLFQAVTLYLLTCFVVVGSDEQAVIEILGQPRDMRDSEGNRTALGPGLHLKWPWPIETAHTHPISRIHTLTIGEQLHEDVQGYTWTVSHAKEPFSVVVANRPDEEAEEQAPPVDGGTAPRRAPPVSLLTGTVIVYYRTNNLYNYLYNHEDPEKALYTICNRALIRYAAQEDFLELLGYKRAEAVAALKAEIDRVAEERSLGVEVTQVLLQGLHPPVEVGPAFEEVVGALEKKEALIWEAKADRERLIPEARAEATQEVEEAKAYSERLKNIAPARAKRFLHQLDAYRKAPEVFLHRKRLAAMVTALADRRKIIMPAWADTDKVLNLDLKDVMSLGTELGLGEIAATEERDEK